MVITGTRYEPDDETWDYASKYNWQRHTPDTLTLHMNTPWYPPSGEVVGEISAVFDCEMRHSYSEPVSEISGYDCYDGGEHIDGQTGALSVPLSGQLLCLVSDESSSLTQEVSPYREARG